MISEMDFGYYLLDPGGPERGSLQPRSGFSFSDNLAWWDLAGCEARDIARMAYSAVHTRGTVLIRPSHTCSRTNSRSHTYVGRKCLGPVCPHTRVTFARGYTAKSSRVKGTRGCRSSCLQWRIAMHDYDEIAPAEFCRIRMYMHMQNVSEWFQRSCDNYYVILRYLV